MPIVDTTVVPTVPTVAVAHTEYTNMRPLQNVLNSAARVVLKMSKFQHITAAVRNQFHWLPGSACETTCGVQAGVIRVQSPPSDSSIVPCRHVSTHVARNCF